jgi:hypothetical protein
MTRMTFNPIQPGSHPAVKDAAEAHAKSGNPAKNQIGSNVKGNANRRAVSGETLHSQHPLSKRLTGRR